MSTSIETGKSLPSPETPLAWTGPLPMPCSAGPIMVPCGQDSASPPTAVSALVLPAEAVGLDIAASHEVAINTRIEGPSQEEVVEPTSKPAPLPDPNLWAWIKSHAAILIILAVVASVGVVVVRDLTTHRGNPATPSSAFNECVSEMREQFAMAYAAGFTTEAVNTGWHYFDGFPEPQSEYVALLQTWGTLRQAAHPASVLWGTIDDSINAYCSVHSPGGS